MLGRHTYQFYLHNSLGEKQLQFFLLVPNDRVFLSFLFFFFFHINSNLPPCPPLQNIFCGFFFFLIQWRMGLSLCTGDSERPIKIKNKLVTFSKLDIVICLSAGRCLGQPWDKVTVSSYSYKTSNFTQCITDRLLTSLNHQRKQT